jgi:hypothetical protein
MAKMRIPNFPTVPLGPAIDLVAKIFREDRANAIDKEVAAKHMGYTGLTGRTLKLLGALSQYGLIEKVAKGQVRVSKNAVSILHWSDEDEKREAIAKAGTSPALFRRIRTTFQDEPSERTITSFLIKEGFTDSAIPAVLKSYRETNRFLAEAGVSESYGKGGQEEADSFSDDGDNEDADEMETIVETLAKPPHGGKSPSKEQGLDSLFWNKGPLDFNLSSAGLVVVGKTNSAKELNAFIDKLKALTVLLPNEPQEDSKAADE